MPATMNNRTDISQLIINLVDTKDTFTEMQTNNQVNSNELYFIQGTDAMAKLKIGTYEYDGTQDVTIPVYDGTIE